MSPVTTDPTDPRLGRGVDKEPRPQQAAYLVLSVDEIAKGFVRPLRRTYKHEVCGSLTTMNPSIAATYARQPDFYGSTYCFTCRKHLPLSEFRWEPDGSVVGS